MNSPFLHQQGSNNHLSIWQPVVRKKISELTAGNLHKLQWFLWQRLKEVGSNEIRDYYPFIETKWIN